jgi:ParB/RepB/Spo0J family partition protein
MVAIKDLKTHPAQPPGRARNTKDLQPSIRQHGVLEPLLVTQDNYTVSGERRKTAATAVGLQEVPAKILPFDHDDPQALDVLYASNEQQETTHLERLHVLRSYEQHGIGLMAAATRAGVSPTEASFLAKLAKAPEEIQEAIERFDRSKGKDGMAWSAWKEMANEPPEVQLEQLGSGRTKTKQVKADRKKRVEEKKSARMENIETGEAQIALCRQVAENLGQIYTFTTNGASDQAKADIRVALSQAANIMVALRKELA